MSGMYRIIFTFDVIVNKFLLCHPYSEYSLVYKFAELLAIKIRKYCGGRRERESSPKVVVAWL
jgi:hypothetical protein